MYLMMREDRHFDQDLIKKRLIDFEGLVLKAYTCPTGYISVGVGRNLETNGITEEELGFSKNYIINSFPFSVETAQKRLEREMGNYLLGRTPAYLESYLDKIAAVDVDGVRKALAAHLSPTRMRVTVLGRADELEPGLSAMPEVGSVRVIEYDAPLGEVLL